MDIIFMFLQAILMIVIGITFWQIWRFLKRRDIPENEPLGEERVKYLTDRLNILQVGIILEAVLFIIQIVLQIIEHIGN